VQANVRDLKEMQTWLMETGIPLLLSGAQEDARVAFEEKIGSLTAGNPGLAVILEDAGLSVLQPDIGAKIRQLVSEQEEILAELGAEENHPEEDGPLLTPERPDRPKTKKRRQEPPFKDGDPFAEMEEKDSNKNATIPLYTKAMIVEFALKLHRENSVTSIEREVMSRFKKFFFSYESNAWKSGLLGKWTRRALGLADRYRKGHSSRVSPEVESAFNEVLERMVAGSNRDLQSAAHLKIPVLVETAQSIQKKWKDTYRKKCEEEHIPFLERQKPVDSKWVCLFLMRWQWSLQASNTKGAFLADDSQEMKEMRLAHRAQILANKVPIDLVLNFDQLWRSAYEPPKKVIHKRRAKEAERQGEEWGECWPGDLQGKRLKAILQMVSNAMVERMGQTDRPSKLRKVCARSDFVQGGRIGVTAVTSTWASGEIGPLGICVANGALPQAFIEEVNEKWAGHVYVFQSMTESHFMTAETTLLHLQELISPALELRRASLGYNRETPALLICDGFTGNFAVSNGEGSRREMWSKENNCILPLRPPGGWSATGQPCDAWHHIFRKLANNYTDSLLGYKAPGLEQATRQIQIGLNGQKHLQATAVDNVKSLIFAWQQMGQKIYHKLFRWAWVSRGVITVDDMKKRFPNLSQKEAEEMQLKEEASARELAEGQQDEWINLPLLMSQFADKGYSKYQLQLFEARRRHEAGKLSKKKFHAAERDCLRTLVLLHTSGQPATAQYIKTHDGSRATLILYNFLERTIKIGILPPEPLRVLRAETTFDASSLQVEVDKDFLEKVCLPGLEAYQNSQSDPEPEEEEHDQGVQLQTMDELAAEGMQLVPMHIGSCRSLWQRLWLSSCKSLSRSRKRRVAMAQRLQRHMPC
ncbi:Malate dehydrogenase 2, partial [Durusdinium trenchii]